MSQEPGPQSLQPTPMIDSEHPAVVALAREATGDTPRERAVSLYYLVRDRFRYDPYRIELTPEGLRGSAVIENGYGWCVPKANLLAAVARAAGIPARVGYADVRNHLSTERLRETMKTDLFVWHGFTELWLDGQWIKATPAFNLALCERFGLLPLEFDGRADSIYHAFDQEGRRHMEYVRQRGSFDEVPLQAILADFAVYYPWWTTGALQQASFDADVNREAPATPA